MSMSTSTNIHRAQSVKVRTIKQADAQYITLEAYGADEADYNDVAIFLADGVDLHMLDEDLVLAGPKPKVPQDVADIAAGLTEGQKVHLANHLWKHYQIGAQKLLKGSEGL